MKKIKIVFRLDEILKEQGRGVRELSRATGLSVATISRIVNHHTRGMYLDVVERLCNELHVEPQELFKLVPVK